MVPLCFQLCSILQGLLEGYDLFSVGPSFDPKGFQLQTCPLLSNLLGSLLEVRDIVRVYGGGEACCPDLPRGSRLVARVFLTLLLIEGSRWPPKFESLIDTRIIPRMFGLCCAYGMIMFSDDFHKQHGALGQLFLPTSPYVVTSSATRDEIRAQCIFPVILRFYSVGNFLGSSSGGRSQDEPEHRAHHGPPRGLLFQGPAERQVVSGGDIRSKRLEPVRLYL